MTKTNIRVLIVGAGYAGLGCAIECKRKGHDVVVLERMPEFKMLGEFLCSFVVISLGVNAGRIIARWGLHDELWNICGHAPELRLHNYAGELIRQQPFPSPLFGAYSYNGHRAHIHDVLLRHALSIGVEVRMGKDVVGYWEEETGEGAGSGGKAGVVLQGGERVVGDVVVAADGVKSRGREYVLGYHAEPRSSGYAVYRAWFDAEEQGVDKDPLTDYLVKNGDVLYGWIGKDVHMLASSRAKKDISWVITHKDTTYVDGRWSLPGKIEDVLAIVKDWHPRCAAIISKAPSCVDWKLLVHDPLPTWVSKKGRVVLVGDAAHPFLPTSIQGASQAIEDGVTIAVCLLRAGKSRIPLGTRTWESIRYDRVREAQLMGESTRDKWHRVQIGDKGPSFDLPMPEWLLNFDAEDNAHGAFEREAKRFERDGYRMPGERSEGRGGGLEGHA
ncbi:monooxygenase [Phlebopus sp. FC_14]|nr:monooxygenase [Phlebopus sp. FC_14]